MSKMLHLETGSYMPISNPKKRLRFDKSSFPNDPEIIAARTVASMLAHVGTSEITGEDRAVADLALAKMEARKSISDEAWNDKVAQEFSILRG